MFPLIFETHKNKIGFLFLEMKFLKNKEKEKGKNEHFLWCFRIVSWWGSQLTFMELLNFNSQIFKSQSRQFVLH